MKYLKFFETFNLDKHLKGRGIDKDKTRVIIDEESSDVFFFLYNLSGKMVGYQKYNPLYDKKGQDSKKMDDPKKTKYYNWVGDEGYELNIGKSNGKKIAVWGVRNI